MINLTVNGDSKNIEPDTSVADALKHWGYQCENIAVAINLEFVPRSQYQQQCLSDQDCVDIVTPIQGG
jgi:sulfur carrier protein